MKIKLFKISKSWCYYYDKNNIIIIIDLPNKFKSLSNTFVFMYSINNGLSYVCNLKIEQCFNTPPIILFKALFTSNTSTTHPAHVICQDANHPTKTALFILPEKRHAQTVWHKVLHLLGMEKERIIPKNEETF